MDFAAFELSRLANRAWFRLMREHPEKERQDERPPNFILRQ
jgi:hypothetical protein